MIDELKYILDRIGDVSGFALWIVGGFMIYKLVIYLSTTGAFVYVAKLLIMKIHDAITREKKVITKDYNIEGMMLTCDSYHLLVNTLRSFKIKFNRKEISLSSAYMTKEHVNWLADAIDEKFEREKK